MTFQTGDRVQITFNGETAIGEVLLASASGLSMMLFFDQRLGGYVNLMPVLWLNNTFVDLLLAEPVSISHLHKCSKHEIPRNAFDF